MTHQSESTTNKRRSFVRKELADIGGEFEFRNDFELCTRIGNGATKSQLLLCDLSPLPRAGLVDRIGIAPFHISNPIPDDAKSQLIETESGHLVAALGLAEYLILPNILNLSDDWTCLTAEADSWQYHRLPRQDSHFWFAVWGSNSNSLLERLFSVDLRRSHFPGGSVVQTLLFNHPVIIINQLIGTESCVHILASSSTAVSCWSSIGDLIKDLGGTVCGFDDFLEVLAGFQQIAPAEDVS